MQKEKTFILPILFYLFYTKIKSRLHCFNDNRRQTQKPQNVKHKRTREGRGISASDKCVASIALNREARERNQRKCMKKTRKLNAFSRNAF